MKNYNKSFKNKVSYPNNNDYINIQSQRDIPKWLQAVKDIYYKEKNGDNRANSVRQVTSGWNTVEIFDFLNWFKFYEEGSHLKYKTAQLWYENDTPGYFLHIKQDPKPDEQNNIDLSKGLQSEEDFKSEERKQIIERQRAKIIGRLDSAEKLLRTRDGQLFADKELESLIEAIFALKKKVFLVNKISTSTRLYEDMIIREANILTKNGHYNAADVLFSIADAVPTATPPQPPAQSSGNVGGLPAAGNGMPVDSESSPNNTPQLDLADKPSEDEVPNGLKIFLNRMETANTTGDDELLVEDDNDIIVEAQAIPPIDEPMTSSPMPAPGNKKDPFTPTESLSKNKVLNDEPLEVEDESLEVKDESNIPNFPDQAESVASDFDVKLDQLMSKVTIGDVVVELESLSKIFKTREIPRRLSRADMMLDSLGLAPFFPSLSEAQNKSLEANNYISSRVDEILSKLRGSMNAKRIDLEGDEEINKPELSGIKNKLQEDEDKEVSRKKMRKEQELLESTKSLNKETPQVEIQEDLSKPIPLNPSQQLPANKPILTK